MPNPLLNTPQGKPLSLGTRITRDFKQYAGAYVMVLPVLAFFIIFSYKPMLGALIAFKNFSPRLGIFRSSWAGSYGFEHFLNFFNSYYFWRLLRNTVTISFAGLIFGFPVPIVFALMINEVKNAKFKKSVQTISYMPHFISLVVVCSMIRLFVSEDGFIVYIMQQLGYTGSQNLLNVQNAFVPIYILSDVWQNAGWNSIIYLAALSAIDLELYEAARIDGANRWRQTVHVTLPGITGTIILLLILRIGQVMSVGHEKIILLYNDFIMERADVISSYVYRRGLVNGDWSFSTAVGLFNSVINFTLVIMANRLSNKVTGMGLW
ncbi:MAG: sugar ABC transporter permease [Clostridiaceae bacterium]|jgi:putative aldouronate transport system permease protein|nr:sugar ABC transporter permease [Clostridiaceae bacterium]